MDELALKSLFEKISSDSSLRKTLMEAIQPPTDAASTSENTQPPSGQTEQHTNNASQVADEHLPDDPSLVADVHQSRGVNGRGADVPSLSVNPQATEDLAETDGVQIQGRSVDNSVAFDPAAVAPSDEFVFDTHEVITNYLEKHFRSSLDKDVRNSMHKMHPVPRTPVMKVLNVDRYMMDHLRQCFLKSHDGELGTVQAALLSAAGPLMCLWSDLVDNNLLADDSAVINVHDVLNIIQHMLVLMGNANELLSQAQRCNILQCIDKTLEKYGKEPRSNSLEFLLGEEFCSQLKSKVKLDKILSQVISLLKHFHPYREQCRDSRQTTLGQSKQQFF